MRDDLRLQRTRRSATLCGRATGDMNEKPNILIVEDDTPVSMLMVFLLTRAGFATDVATSGGKAMQKTQTGEYDLITLDVDLPDMSGFDLCSRLRKHPVWRDTPVVFVSRRLNEEDRQRGFEVGAVDYIIKPFGADNFVSRIRPHVKTGGHLNLLEVTLGDSP